MKAKNEILLSDALRRAGPHGWPKVAIRDAVVRGEIPSRRSSARKNARYLVKWLDVASYMDALMIR